MITSSAKKEKNNRFVYEKLKKDFSNFFNKEITFPENSLLNTPKAPFKDKSPISTGKCCGVFTPKLKKTEDSLAFKGGKNTLEMLKKGTPIKLKNYIKLMHVLGFIYVKSRSSLEEEMLTDCWKLLGGTNDNSIKAENLFVVLAGIMNIELPDIVKTEEESHENHSNQGKLCYD